VAKQKKVAKSDIEDNRDADEEEEEEEVVVVKQKPKKLGKPRYLYSNSF